MRLMLITFLSSLSVYPIPFETALGSGYLVVT